MSRRVTHTETITCDRCGHEVESPYREPHPQQPAGHYGLPALWGRVTWDRHCIPYSRELCPDCLEHCHATLQGGGLHDHP